VIRRESRLGAAPSQACEGLEEQRVVLLSLVLQEWECRPNKRWKWEKKWEQRLRRAREREIGRDDVDNTSTGRVPIERNTQKSKGGRERDFVIERDALLDEQEGGLIYMRAAFRLCPSFV
jgi:hypothetical protein